MEKCREIPAPIYFFYFVLESAIAKQQQKTGERIRYTYEHIQNAIQHNTRSHSYFVYKQHQENNKQKMAQVW